MHLHKKVRLKERPSKYIARNIGVPRYWWDTKSTGTVLDMHPLNSGPENTSVLVYINGKEFWVSSRDLRSICLWEEKNDSISKKKGV